MSHRSLFEPILTAADHNRLTAAAYGMRSGTFDLTPTHESEAEFRALVKNGDGHEYGVSLRTGLGFCSCKDFLYRHNVQCKHILAACLFLLAQDAEEEMEASTVHLMWESGEILCGHSLTPTTRFWRNWTLNALNWSDIVCQSCVHTWLHPTPAATHLAA